MKIIIIEDDTNYAELVARALEGLAKPAVVATSWEDAEQYLKEPDTNVMWIDLRMPTSSEARSVEKIKDVRQRFSDIVMIVASGYITPIMREELKAAGVDGFLYKGDHFDPRQVASLIITAMMSASGRSAKVDKSLLPKALEWMHQRFPMPAAATKPPTK